MVSRQDKPSPQQNPVFAIATDGYGSFTEEVPVPGEDPDALYRNRTKKGFTVEEAIDHIGFGWVQARIGLMAGMSWVADGMEIMLLSILGNILFCEWNISRTQEALMTTVVFIGFSIGSPIFGWWADKYGRRKIIIFSAVWILYFGVLSAMVPTYTWLLIMRSITGFGIGALAQAVTYYEEFLPSKTRGKAIILVEMFWVLGSMIEAVLALLLRNYGWRIWLVATASPLLLCIWFFMLLPTSPHFDMACGRTEAARKTLEELARSNGKSLPPGELLAVERKERGQLKDLLSPAFRRTSALLALLWFCGTFLYYGLILFTTTFIQIGSTCAGNDNSESSDADIQSFHCFLGCKTFTVSDYVQLIWTSMAEVPGLFMTVLLVDRMERPTMLIIQNLLFSIFCLCLLICMNRIPMLLLLFTCRALIASSMQTLFVYTPEVYPTEVRALSIGIGCGCGRVGAVVTPYIAKVLLDWSTTSGLLVYTGVGLVATIGAVLLQREIKSKAAAAENECSSLY